MRLILVTGSEGLVGTSLSHALRASGFAIQRCDIACPVGHAERVNILDLDAVTSMARKCVGIVHLAAVSRVVCGEREPNLCWRTNAEGTQNVLRAALGQEDPPWVVFASSREVYGQADELPVNEGSSLKPVNIYGRAKVAAERAVDEARGSGLRTAVVRLSNVYGSTTDHADRVVPAFTRSAALGMPLRVDGSGHTFDFTHLNDTARGILAIIKVLEAGETKLPPIHLVTGRPTTLGQLAELANAANGNRSEIIMAPPRSFDVAHFYGNPARAKELLGWSANVRIEDGIRQMVEAFAAEARESSNRNAALKEEA
ncbi:MAG: NAD-dependent epimerase/dehydratase family protein [Chloroflexi bacterium]|nr:NAD-dependent epimerase/dehydratase family protein [Chloroflexota bacterium]